MSEQAPVFASNTWMVICAVNVGCRTPALESEAATAQEVRIEAFSEGWRVDRYGDWYCEACALKRDREGDDDDRWVPLHLIQVSR